MDYELAKQLQDAGFPQSGAGSRVAPPEAIVARRDVAYVPTLEELIEACGEGNLLIHRTELATDPEEPWTAKRTNGEFPTFGDGKTATEAVARLWISLHPQTSA